MAVDKDSQNFIFTAIGLMSGTSMDGIDVALIRTDGNTVAEFGGNMTVPYTPDQRNIIARSISEANTRDEAETQLTHWHAEAIAEFLSRNRLDKTDIDVIGFHGQTVEHASERHHTVQLGDGALLAELTGIDVVNNFRVNDMRHGGQGAPLLPVYHKALIETLPTSLSVIAFINIGGVGNITYFERDEHGQANEESIIAFDTGPGNGLMDDWVSKHTEYSYDEGGTMAANGQVNESSLSNLLSHSYFKQPPPKSLDRFDLTLDAVEALNLEDGTATLAAFTAESIAQAQQHLPKPVQQWIVTGGGRHNPILMDMLQKAVAQGEVNHTEAHGWDGDAIEAQGFAYMAVRRLLNQPISYPSTTGATKPVTGGDVYQGAHDVGVQRRS